MNDKELIRMADEISGRERMILGHLFKVRIATHGQLGRLAAAGETSAITSGESAARSMRRILARMTEGELVNRFERRIGGVRAGSAGHVYQLGSTGHAICSYWQGHGLVRGRSRSEPGSRYMRHRLAVTELYAELNEAHSAGAIELISFEIEPESWRSYPGGLGEELTLKPDAFLRLGAGDFEDRFFIEVDLGTEGSTTIQRKLQNYLDYFHSGIEQDREEVFPRVLFITNTETRKESLVGAASRLDADYWALFTITTQDRAMEILRSPLIG